MSDAVPKLRAGETLRLAVLDDWQRLAPEMAEWSRLAGRAEVTFFHERREADEDALARRLAPFDILCVMRERTPFPRRLVERLPRLRLLVTTGLRNPALDLGALAERGVWVLGTETPGLATAELAWGLILGVMRRIPQEDRAVRAGLWQTALGEDLSGRRLAVLGPGRLGRAVGAVGRAFGMDVLEWRPDRAAGRPAEGSASLAALHGVLAQADIVSLHLVLSEVTRGLIGARELGVMKRSAYLINTARSRLVDEAALVAALQEGRLAGAGLDVFDEEPLAADHPLLALTNVVLTPHSGHLTYQTFEGFYRQTLEAVESFLAGRPARVLACPGSAAQSIDGR